jgi:hypothetical protein
LAGRSYDGALTLEFGFDFLNYISMFAMKSLFLRLVAALSCLAFASLAVADGFKSQSFTGSLDPIRVHGDQILLIRNFTQDGVTSDRGVVAVDQVNVLTAAILDPTDINQGSLEVINSVVIAGPANVIVTCGTGRNCFISYRKDNN